MAVKVGTDATDYLYGNNGEDDTLDGRGGNDFIYGSTGNDTLIGGLGDDTFYVLYPSNTVVEYSGEGTDLVNLYGYNFSSYTLPANVENLQLYSYISGNVTGNDLDNNLFGSQLADVLDGAGGNDILDGSYGADQLIGGTGDDLFIINDPRATVVELAGGGYDTISAYVNSYSYTLPQNVEKLILNYGGYGAGNADDNVIVGGDSGLPNNLNGFAGNDDLTGGEYHDDFLDGGTGADRMAGRGGNDAYVVDDAGDRVVELPGEGNDRVTTSIDGYTLPDNVEQLVLAGSATHGNGNALDNALFGTAAADTLDGKGGDDFLDGGAGGDVMIGGDGNDQFVVDSAGDFIVEQAGGGNDKVFSRLASYTLPGNVEQLVLQDGAVNGTGNGLDNLIQGNAAANVLDGASGDDVLYGGGAATDPADTLRGGGGNDQFYVLRTADRVVEQPGEGYDVVFSQAADYTLSDNVERLVLLNGGVGTGNGGANDLIGMGAYSALHGMGGDDHLTGTALDDTLDGGTGADLMTGGAGNDLYFVDNVADRVVEQADGGNDRVMSSLAATVLPDEVEQLVLLDGAVTGTGNALDNLIVGNAAANMLIGLDGNDTLDGGGDADRMDGGQGNDQYLVDNVGDMVIEAPGGGNDKVVTTLASYTLQADVEQLVGTAASGQSLGGNASDNLVRGGEGNDILSGGGGDDVLEGGGGSDRLEGGGGNDVLEGGFLSDDVFVFNPGFGHDRITDFNAAGHDVLSFDHSIFANYADVMAHAYQSEAGAIITAGSGDSILVEQVSLASLDASHFLFT